MNDICENLCEAVRIIIEGEQQKNPPRYDITKDCIIVDVKNKHKGCYGVSDGSSTFEAYATAGTMYALGDQVLITIPQGDYNNQKTILNKVITEYADTIGYKSPLSNFVKGSGNLIQGSKMPVGIEANGDVVLQPIWQLQKTDEFYFCFTRLAIVADFMTLLRAQDITSGEYGLKLIAYGSKSDPDASAPVVELTFSASEMLGNIYNFNSYFKQEIVFTMPSNINAIDKMELYLYQDGNFKDGNNNFVESIGINNIFVDNIELYLGYQDNYLSQEIVEIACDDLTYNNQSLNRSLVLRWLHKVDEGVFDPITNINFNRQQHEVRWYRYVSGCSEEEIDEYGGKNWQLLNRNDSPMAPSNWPMETEFPPADYPFMLPVSLNKNQSTEKFKVVTILKDYPLINDPTYMEIKYYDSNILEFINTEESSAGGSNVPEQKPEVWSLHFHDNSFGNYFIYDQNGQLIDGPNQSSLKRTVELYYMGKELSLNHDLYSAIKYIQWEVPAKKSDSMIIYENDQGIENPEDNLLKNYKLGEPIAYSNIGTFDYSAQIPEVPKTNGISSFDKIKILLYTSTDNDVTNASWNKLGQSPYSRIQTVSGDKVNIKTQFTINRNYKYFKIIYKYYKQDIEVNVNDVVVQNHIFKLASTFHTGTMIPWIDNNGVRQINTKFKYTIASNWNASRNNNIIKCTIGVEGQDRPITIAENLRFGQKGTSGTSNTFILEMLDGKNALLAQEGETLQVEALLIDTKGQLISLQDASIKWEIINQADDPYIELITTTTSSVITLKSKVETLKKDNYAILHATYTYPVADMESGKTPELHAFLPIPFKTNSCIAMSGGTQIIYNHMGIPSYSATPYIAYSVDQSNGSIIENYIWNVDCPQNNPNPIGLTAAAGVRAGKALAPVPHYSSQQGNANIIQDRACVYCDGLWSQPILIMQSAYDFAMLNSWDGNLTIDENNGTILSTMLGAGKKNSDNKFSGVLIGDVEGGTGLQNTSRLTGVYGFQNGIVTYGLQENGTAFFGAQNNGRIEIDGINGIIKSPTAQGMSIDLNSGLIKASKFTLSAGYWGTDSTKAQGRVVISTAGEKNTSVGDINTYYFGVGTKDNHISLTTDGILSIKAQNFNFSSSDSKIKLTNGAILFKSNDSNIIELNNNGLTIKSTQFSLSSGYWGLDTTMTQGRVILSNVAIGDTKAGDVAGEQYYFGVGTKDHYIRLNNQGNLIIKTEGLSIDNGTATFSGKVVATSGTIGKCNIDEEGNLKITNAHIDNLDVGKLTAGTNTASVIFTHLTASGATINGNTVLSSCSIGDGGLSFGDFALTKSGIKYGNTKLLYVSNTATWLSVDKLQCGSCQFTNQSNSYISMGYTGAVSIVNGSNNGILQSFDIKNSTIAGTCIINTSVKLGTWSSYTTISTVLSKISTLESRVATLESKVN